MRLGLLASAPDPPLLAGSAGDEAELGLGGDGVDDVGDGGALVVGELAEVGEAGVECVAGGVQGAAGRVGGDEVVDADVEGLGDADDGFEAGQPIRERAGRRGNLWRARWRSPDGTLESKPGFRTRKDAETYARDQEAASRGGTYIDPRAGQTTLTDWVNLWYPTLDLEPTTLSNYRYQIEVHILPAFGNRPLASLTREEIAAWELATARRGYTPAPPATPAPPSAPSSATPSPDTSRPTPPNADAAKAAKASAASPATKQPKRLGPPRFKHCWSPNAARPCRAATPTSS
jgi:hypothetical protein